MIINTILALIRGLSKLLYNIRALINTLITCLILYFLYKIWQSWILWKILEILEKIQI